MTLQAVTLTQPWATFCVVTDPMIESKRFAIKPLETRDWRIAEYKLPMRLVIHAAKAIRRPEREAIVDDWEGAKSGEGRHTFTEPFASLLELVGYSKLEPWQRNIAPHATPLIPLASVVGIVTVTKMVRAADVTRAWQEGRVSDRTYQLGNFTPGRWAWQCENPVKLEPIPCRGMQGIWNVPADVEHIINLQLAKSR